MSVVDPNHFLNYRGVIELVHVGMCAHSILRAEVEGRAKLEARAAKYKVIQV